MKMLNEIVGTRYPFIQGGMANIATAEFAAAASEAGALGMIGAGGMNADSLRDAIRRCRKITQRPFGVNLMLLDPNAPDMAEVIAQEGVRIVSTGAGSPATYMDMWKKNGIFVMPVAASVTLAKRMVEEGADAIIAEGTESGGHVGEMTTMTLVPQMVDGVDVPVIAAGGIADGRTLAAAFALGACGVQMGTRLLASCECPVHENYKQEVLKAGDNSTIVTGRRKNAPVRCIKNPMTRKYVRLENEAADRAELEKYTLGSLKKAVRDGNLKEGSFMCGQVCGMVNDIRPLAEIFESIESGCQRVIKGMCDEC